MPTVILTAFRFEGFIKSIFRVRNEENPRFADCPVTPPSRTAITPQVCVPPLQKCPLPRSRVTGAKARLVNHLRKRQGTAWWKKDRSNLCAAPPGPLRQIGRVPFFHRSAGASCLGARSRAPTFGAMLALDATGDQNQCQSASLEAGPVRGCRHTPQCSRRRNGGRACWAAD